MTRSDRERLARTKGVSVATVNRWIRQGGESAALGRIRTSASEAGRRARAANPSYGRRPYEHA